MDSCAGYVWDSDTPRGITIDFLKTSEHESALSLSLALFLSLELPGCKKLRLPQSVLAYCGSKVGVKIPGGS